MLTRTSLLVLSVLFFSTLAASQPSKQLWQQPFLTMDGVYQSPAELASQKRGALVMFWASWCVPCQEELSLVMAHKDALQDIALIAINVDEPDSWSAAENMLGQTQWDGFVLRDTSGAYFGGLQADGSLPLALLYSSDGQWRGRYTVLSHETLGMLTRDLEAKPIGTGPFSASVNAYYRYQSPGQGLRHADLWAMRDDVGYTSGAWDIQTGIEALAQRRPGDQHFREREDDVAPSYVRWSSSKDSDSFTRITVGDDTFEWVDGLLLSVRHSVADDVDDRLTGMHALYAQKTWRIEARGGKARRSLFQPSLDVNVDQSMRIGDERMGGLWAAWTPNAMWSSEWGVAQFERSHMPLIVGEPDSKDKRGAAKVGWHSALVSSNVSGAVYKREKVKDVVYEDGKISRADVSLGLNQPVLGQLVVQQMENLPDYTHESLLPDEQVVPLIVQKKTGYKVALRWQIVPRSWQLLPSFVSERDMSEPKRHQLLVYGLGVHGPIGSKLSGWQREEKGMATLEGASKENIYQLLTPLVPMWSLSGQVLHKAFRAEGDDGERTTYSVERAWSRVTVAVTGTTQTAHYVRDSGLNAKQLGSARVKLSQDIWQANVAVGREPGGYVCTSSSCSYRPPLAGASVDLACQLSF